MMRGGSLKRTPSLQHPPGAASLGFLSEGSEGAFGRDSVDARTRFTGGWANLVLLNFSGHHCYTYQAGVCGGGGGPV